MPLQPPAEPLRLARMSTRRQFLKCLSAGIIALPVLGSIASALTNIPPRPQQQPSDRAISANYELQLGDRISMTWGDEGPFMGTVTHIDHEANTAYITGEWEATVKCRSIEETF